MNCLLLISMPERTHNIVGKLLNSPISSVEELVALIHPKFVLYLKKDNIVYFYANFKNKVILPTVRSILGVNTIEIASAQDREILQNSQNVQRFGRLNKKLKKRHRPEEKIHQLLPISQKYPEISNNFQSATFYSVDQVVETPKILLRQLLPHETVGNRGHWIFGQGGSGKTRSVIEYCKHAGVGLYQKSAINRYFSGYKGEKAVALDNVRPQHVFYLSTYILEWADSVPCRAECKIENIFFYLQHDFFFVISSLTLDEWLEGKNQAFKGEFKRRFKQWSVNQLQDLIEMRFGVRKDEYIKPYAHMNL